MGVILNRKTKADFTAEDHQPVSLLVTTATPLSSTPASPPPGLMRAEQESGGDGGRAGDRDGARSAGGQARIQAGPRFQQPVLHKHLLHEPLEGRASKPAGGAGNGKNLGKRTFLVPVYIANPNAHRRAEGYLEDSAGR